MPTTQLTVNAVNTPAESAAPAPASDAGADTLDKGERGQPRRLPYDDAVYVVQHLHLKMTTDNFVQGARLWMAVLRDQHPETYTALLHELKQEEQQPA